MKPSRLLLLFVVGILNSVCLLPATAQDKGDESRRAAPMIVLRSIGNDETDFTRVEKSGLTRNDFRGITQMLEGKATIVPLRVLERHARRDEWPTYAAITGTTGDFAKISRMRITQGRFLNSADAANRNNVAVLKSRIAKRLVPDRNPIGRTIRIDEQAFVVVGICKDSATLPETDKADLDIYIPLTTMRARFGDLDVRRASGTFEAFHYELSEIRIGLNDAMHLETVMKAVTKLIGDLHESEDYAIEIDQ